MLKNQKNVNESGAIRIFLSSTFDQDMRKNRDEFRNEINARLNQMFGMYDYNVYLYDLELGVPHVMTNEQKLEICYQRIKECHYFVCVVGFNYGTLLTQFVDEEKPLITEYKSQIEEYLENDLGITESEIMVAKKTDDLKTVFFVHKDVLSLQAQDMENMKQTVLSITQDYQKIHGNERADNRLETQKERITAYYEYLISQQVVDGSKKPDNIGNIIQFAEPVYVKCIDSFKRAIDERDNNGKTNNPYNALKPISVLDVERSILMNIEKTIQLKDKLVAEERYIEYEDIESLGENVVKYFADQLKDIPALNCEREIGEEHKNANLIHAQKTRYYVADKKNEQALDEYLQNNDNRVLVINGEQGSGKSALLLDLERRLEKKADWKIVSCYVGNKIQQAEEVIRKINRVMLEKELSPSLHINPSERTLMEQFAYNVMHRRPQPEKLLILIDGFDEIQYSGLFKGMFWLPKQLPENIKFIVSTSSSAIDPAFSAFKIATPTVDTVLRRIFDYEGKILEFDKVEKKMSAYKHLDNSPLFSVLMGREIILNAKFHNIDEKLDDYFSGEASQETFAIAKRFLNRIEKDYGTEFVQNVLANIYLSRAGLSEEILSAIAGKPVKKLVNVLYHELSEDVKGNICFAHDVLKKAVKEMFVDKLTKQQTDMLRQDIISKLLIDGQLPQSPTLLKEIAYQAYMCGNKTVMQNIFSNIDQVISLSEYRSTLASYIKTVEESPKDVMGRLASQATDAHEMFLAGMYQELKLYKDALKWQKAQMSESKLDPSMISKEQYLATAAIECDMATAFDAEGAFGRALPLAEDALGIFQAQLGGGHPYVATALHTKASIYDSMKMYRNAIKLYEKSIDILKEAYIPNHPAIAMGYSNLGIAYNGKKKYKKALQCYETAEKIYEKSLGENKNLIATLKHNRATVYDNQHCFDKSLESYEEALKIYDDNYGKMNLKSAATLCNIGLLYDRNKIYDKAIECFVEALKIREPMLGADHYETARLYADIAMIDLTRGKYDQAREGFEKTVKVYEKTFGSNYFETQMLYARIQECIDKKARFG